MRFIKRSRIAAPAPVVFAFHERPDAFQRLQPPWQTTEIVKPPASLAVGTEVIVRVRVGPIWQTVVAEHVEYEPGRMFADTMRKGPFKRWLHRHIVEPDGPDHSILTDDIEYELPLGVPGRIAGGPFVRRMLERMFEYRHAVTRADCEGGATSAGP